MKGKYKNKNKYRQDTADSPKKTIEVDDLFTAGVEKQPEKRFRKKQVITAIIVGVIVVALTVGLCLYFLVFKNKTDNYKYYNNFESGRFTEAECILNLSQDIYVAGVDIENEIFITARKTGLVEGTEKIAYGLASLDAEYIQPVYYNIMSIEGDYAIVARYAMSEGENEDSVYIDVIKFRGKDAPYSLMPQKSVVYSSFYTQMQFINEYIAVYGELDNISSTPSYTTFYDYTSGIELLEKFRIRSGYDSVASQLYNYVGGDGYLAAYSTDRIYFYDLNTDPIRGYVERCNNGEYIAFSEMNDLSDYEREIQVYYMGNGWFSRTAKLSKSKPFDGFNIILFDLEDGGEDAKYARTKSDFFNVKTGMTKEYSNIYCIAGVANQYTYTYYTQETYYLMGLREYDEDRETYSYNLPFANPTAMIKDGYSILYFYYLPYIEDYYDDKTTYKGYIGETTYCILDENMKLFQPMDSLLPIAYIDGIGIQTADPYYTQNSGTAYIYDKDMNATVLASFEKGTVTYIPYYANKEACIIQAIKKVDEESVVEYYGAVTPEGKQITDYVYEELSMFSGGYAIGCKLAENKKTYYRIGIDGTEEEIDDVIAVFSGVYTYRDGANVGVKNFYGDVLIQPIDGTITVAEVTMNEGNAVKIYVIVSGDTSKIYVLK